MNRKIILTVCIVSLLLVMTGSSRAGVDVNVNIGLPLFTFAEPPELVVIPDTYVYFVPGLEFDIVFYHGYWYRPYGSYWYRARGYNGPWHHIGRERVPRYIFNLPPDYRHIYHDHPRIPHYHVHDNWNRWEREKYWHKRQWKHEHQEWKRDRREDRRERRQDIRENRQDRREDRRELRKDMRKERRENRQENRQDIREQRQERREQPKGVKPGPKENRQEKRDEKQRPDGDRR